MRSPSARRPRPSTRARAAATALAAALTLQATALLLSCGGAAPELKALEWRLELRPSEAGAYESLSVFANLRDSDGIEDIEALWLVADEAELSWSIDDANWLRRDEGGETWIGASGLSMPDYGSLPRGDYRLVAADLAGRRAERRFGLEPTGALPPLPSCRFEAARPGAAAAPGAAQAQASQGTAIIDSAWPETLLLAYDGSGALLKAAAARTGRNDLAAVLGTAEAGKTAALASYGYDPARRIGAYSWKTKTR